MQLPRVRASKKDLRLTTTSAFSFTYNSAYVFLRCATSAVSLAIASESAFAGKCPGTRAGVHVFGGEESGPHLQRQYFFLSQEHNFPRDASPTR